MIQSFLFTHFNPGGSCASPVMAGASVAGLVLLWYQIKLNVVCSHLFSFVLVLKQNKCHLVLCPQEQNKWWEKKNKSFGTKTKQTSFSFAFAGTKQMEKNWNKSFGTKTKQMSFSFLSAGTKQME